jgi:hypothetical protein
LLRFQAKAKQNNVHLRPRCAHLSLLDVRKAAKAKRVCMLRGRRLLLWELCNVRSLLAMLVAYPIAFALAVASALKLALN